MGPSTFNLVWCLEQPGKPGSKSYDSLVTIVTLRFSSKLLAIAEFFQFHKRNQDDGESVTVFVAALKKLAEHCDFNEVLNDTIRDQIVRGLRSEAVQKHLLTESAFTLDKAIDISVSMELAAKEAHQLSSAGKLHEV